jgi:hypothetical protein
MREKWTADKLKHTEQVRGQIMACIHRLNAKEAKSIYRAVTRQGGSTLPRPYLRQQIRYWYRQRWDYLISEYEAILPHVEELPDEQVASIVKCHLMGVDCANPPR